MLAIARVAGWKAFTVSQQPTDIKPTEVKVPASLPVRAVRSQIKPIEAWVFNNGEVAAVRFKHLTFQTAGTINPSFVTFGDCALAFGEIPQGSLKPLH